MTPEAQRIAIADACGVQTQFFRFLIPYHDGAEKWRNRYKTREEAEEAHCGCGKWVLSEVEKYLDLSQVPDYPNDLNAMHEAEKALLPDLSRYGTELTKVCDQFAAENGYELLESWRTTATAPQRAEAFLRTLNLWKD